MSAVPALSFAPDLTVVEGADVHPFVAGLPMSCVCGLTSQDPARLPMGYHAGGRFFCSFGCLDAFLTRRHGPQWWVNGGRP